MVNPNPPRLSPWTTLRGLSSSSFASGGTCVIRATGILEELMSQRGLSVDYVNVWRRVQRYARILDQRM
jgi:hypothetical protein